MFALSFIFIHNIVYGTIIEDMYSFDKNINCIYDILPNTSTEEFKSHMKLPDGSNIYRDSTIVDNSVALGSGMILQISDTEKYTIAVLSDISGDGKLSPTDILDFKKILVDIDDNKGYYIYCMDYNNDNNLTSTDLLEWKKVQIGILNDVIIMPKNVIIEQSSITIDLLKDSPEVTLTARVSPISASQEISWESSDSTTAAVTSNGLVTAIKDGNVQITAKDTNGHSATCNIEVITSTPPVVINKRLFIGDSRTVGMQKAVDKSSMDVWSCADSKGITWFSGEGIRNLNNHMGPNTALIILMGVNDTANIKRYLSFINENTPNWTAKGVKVYFVSVNPTHGPQRYAPNTPDGIQPGAQNVVCIEDFNKTMKNGLVSDVTFIDTYHGLDWPADCFDSSGLHYNKTQYRRIYDFIINAINNPNK